MFYKMECSICLEKITDEKKILKCNHEFHKECINLWLNEKKVCPLCRMTLETYVEPIEENSETVPVQTLAILEIFIFMTSFIGITMSLVVPLQSELFLLFPLYSFICLMYILRKVNVHIIKVLGIYIMLSFIINFSLYSLNRKMYDYIFIFSIFIVQTILVEIVSKKRSVENN